MARDSKRSMRESLIIIVMACAVYGALLEWIQFSFTDERSGDALDWLADLLGVLIGLGAAKILEPALNRRS